MALDFTVPTGGAPLRFLALQPGSAIGVGGQPSCAFANLRPLNKYYHYLFLMAAIWNHLPAAPKTAENLVLCKENCKAFALRSSLMVASKHSIAEKLTCR